MEVNGRQQTKAEKDSDVQSWYQLDDKCILVSIPATYFSLMGGEH